MSQRERVRQLARSFYAELTARGYDDRDVVSLATELLGEVTARLAVARQTVATTTACAAAEPA